jgi:beta-barrel assembly-enhancing protease
MENIGRWLGRLARRPVHYGQWVWQILTGTEDQAIEAENRLGADLAGAFALAPPGDSPPAAHALLDSVGRRLAARVANPRWRFSFSLLAGPAINGYALPGGFVYLTEPLVDLCQHDENRVAFALGHEMAHVFRCHARERFLNRSTLSLLTAMAPASTALNQLLTRVSHEVVSNAYSQEHEFEADHWGVRLAAAAGFDPAASLVVLERLGQVGPQPSELGQYFSSHPCAADRTARIRELIRQRYSSS